MSPVFIFCIIVTISSAFGHSNLIHLDELSEKRLDGSRCEGRKGLGYLYDTKTIKFLCSIALINVNRVIADASCAPEGPDFSDIQAVFLDTSKPNGVQIHAIRYPKYILEEVINATLVVFFLIDDVVVTQYVSPPTIWIQPSIQEGPGCLVAWTKRWQLAVDDILISATDRTSHQGIPFKYIRRTLLKDSGQLVVRGEYLLGFSLLARYPKEDIVYLYLGRIYDKIITEMQQQIIDHYNSPCQRLLRLQGEERERLQRQHSGNE